MNIISEEPGHSDPEPTKIYLDSFDDEVMDNANPLITI